MFPSMQSNHSSENSHTSVWSKFILLQEKWYIDLRCITEAIALIFWTGKKTRFRRFIGNFEINFVVEEIEWSLEITQQAGYDLDLKFLFVPLHTANVHYLSLKLGEQNIRLMPAANISDIQEIYHRVATALFALTIAVAFAQFPWLIKEVSFILSSGILMSGIKCPLHQQKLNAFIANKKYRACYPTVLKVKSRSLVS